MEKNILCSPTGKILAYVYSFMDLVNLVQANQVLESIHKEIPLIEGVGYAGFTEKEYLLDGCLKDNLFSKQKNIESESLNLQELLKAIQEPLLKAEDILKGEIIHIFIFPNFDHFIKKHMSGNFGYTPWKNTIHLYVNYLDSKKLGFTLIHELAHALSPYPTSENTIGAILLYEGLAEKFRERLLGGQRSPWTEVLSQEDIKKILPKINLGEINPDTYAKLFFGSEEHLMWSGYSLGYHLANKFLNKENQKEWSKLVRMDMNQQLMEELI